MEYMDWENFWWSSITGPHKVVKAVAETLLSQAAVILHIPADLPWRHSMRSAVEEQFRTLNGASDTIISYIDAAEDCIGVDDPGKFLLQRFATREVLNGYREKSGVSIQDYMKKNAVLRNTIIWVKGLKKEQVSEWLCFCNLCSGSSNLQGRFVLEVHEDIQLSPLEARSTKIVRLRNYVRQYDVQQFNSFILDEENTVDEVWRKYIASLAANLCQTDAEVSEIYLRLTNFTLEEPLDAIGKVAQLAEFQRRGEDPDSDHVLSRWRAGDKAALNQRIWTAQLQTIFPLIEMYRVMLIRSFYEQLQSCLHSQTIMQFNNRVLDPLEVELGTLVYLITAHNDLGYLLYVPNQDVRDEIHFLRECRNLLAHGNCCSCGQIARLFALAGREHED